jgi:hypothetical protein
VLNGETPEQRALLLARFIELGHALFAMRNFNGLMEVKSGKRAVDAGRCGRTGGGERARESTGVAVCVICHNTAIITLRDLYVFLL